MKKILLLNAFVLGLSWLSFAQPSNDECTNAITLNVGTSCVYSSYDNTGATASTSELDPSCASYIGGDIWFKFVVPAGGSVTINSADNGGMYDSGMAWYTGTCGSLTELDCDDDGSTSSNMSKITQTGLTPGSTIFVRFYGYNGESGSFDICATTPPPPPANDECVNALNLTVNSNFSCAAITNGTIESATTSSQANTCLGTADDDVWFKFTATSTDHRVAIQNMAGSTTNIVLAIYDGACATLNELNCNEFFGDDNTNLNGLTIGSTYLVRVFSWSNLSGENTVFDMCVGTPPPPPTNDDCANAISLAVGSSCAYSSYSNESSSASTGVVDPSCAAYIDGDVWFSMVVPAGGAITVNSNTNGGMTDSGMAWYTGSCASLTELICDDDNSENGAMSKITQSGLTPSSTIFVRFWGYSGTQGTFDICASTPPAPPANDECSAAVSLTVNSDLNCASTTSGTVESATTSSQTNTCTGTADDDVWYSFTATSANHAVNLNNITGSVTNLVMAVYDGSCGTLNELSCDQYFGTGTTTLGSLTIGNTYFVRIYSWDVNAETSTFDVCVGTPPPPPANDECANAIDLSISSTCTSLSYTNQSATASSGVSDPTCASYSGGDVWFKFVVPSSGEVTVNSTDIAGMDDSGMAWYTGTCGALTELACNDDGGVSNMSLITQTGLNPSSTIYVRFWGYAGDMGAFEICATSPSATNPVIAIGTTSNPTACSASDGIIQITGTNTGTGTLSWTGTSSGSLNNITLPYTFSNFAAGTYNFTFNDGTLSNQVTTSLNDPGAPATPTISASGSLSFCQGGSVILTSSASSGNTWSTGAITQSITVTASGTYTVYSTVSGCISTTSAGITVSVTPSVTPDIVIASDDTDNSICTGTNVTFTATPTNGGSSPSYQWKINGANVGTNLSTFTSSSLNNNDIVTCVLTSNATCPSPLTATSNSISMTVNTAATASVTISSNDANNSICAGTSVTFTATAVNGGTTPIFQWKINGSNVGTNSSTFTSTSLANGDQITCSLTSSNACGTSTVNSNLITFTVNASPTIAIGSVTNPSSCGNNDGSIQITGSGTGTLSWTGTVNSSLTTTLPTTVNNLSAGSYSFVFTNTCSSNTVSSSLNDPGAPVAPTISASGSLTFCQGGSVNLTSSSTTNNVWSSGQTTQSITVTTSGNYYVTKTVAGCSSSSNIMTVSVNPNPTAAVITAGGSTTICNGGSLVLTSNLTSGNLWSNSANTPSITVSSAGNYFVTTTLGSCTATSNIITVSIATSPVIALGSVSQTTSCGGTDGTIQINGSGSGTISWTGSASGSQSVVLPILLQNFGIGSYNLTFNNGCNSNTVSANISQPALPATPVISAVGNTEFCQGGNVTLVSSSNSGNLWTTNETTQTIVVSTGGFYTVTVSSAPNCTATSNEIEVIVNPVPSTPTITASGATTFCQGGSVVLTSSSTNGNLWTSGDATQSITVISSGSYTVNVTQNGCTSLDATQVIVVVNPVPPTPSITTSGPINFCEGQILTLTSDITSGITWSPNGETTASIIVTTAGDYFVTNSLNGCSASSPVVTTTINPLPSVNLAPIADMCDTSSIIILDQGTPSGGTYTVNGSSASSFTPSSSNIGLNTIVYYVSDNICTNSDTITFNVLDCSSNIGLKEHENNIKLLPNPSAGMFEIHGINLSEINAIQVFDPIGKLILTSTSNHIDLSNYANGMYHLVIKTERFEHVQKVQLLK